MVRGLLGLGGDAFEGAGLDEPSPRRIVVDLNGQTLRSHGARVCFRLRIESRTDAAPSSVQPDADPQPANDAGLVPLDGRGREAEELGVLEGEPGATPSAFGLCPLAVNEIGRR